MFAACLSSAFDTFVTHFNPTFFPVDQPIASGRLVFESGMPSQDPPVSSNLPLCRVLPAVTKSVNGVFTPVFIGPLLSLPLVNAFAVLVYTGWE